MKFSYRLHPGADEDLKDAYAWYEDSQDGLGQRFLDAALAKIDTIAAWPGLYGSKKKGYKETVISKSFPYSIVYKIYTRKKEIVVYSIFHSKRNPRKKYRK